MKGLANGNGKTEDQLLHAAAKLLVHKRICAMQLWQRSHKPTAVDHAFLPFLSARGLPCPNRSLRIYSRAKIQRFLSKVKSTAASVEMSPASAPCPRWRQTG